MLNRNLPAIPCDKIHVIGDRQNLLLFEHAEHFIVRGHSRLFIDEPKHIPDRLIQSLLRLPSGQSGGDRVEKGDSALAVSCDNGLANASQSRSPSLFALQQPGAQPFNMVSGKPSKEHPKPQTQAKAACDHQTPSQVRGSNR